MKFASRAKKVQNKPIVNTVISDEALLKKYRGEINELKSQLEQVRNNESNEKRSDSELILLEHIEKLKRVILTSGCSNEGASKKRIVRRQTWFAGKANIDDSDDEIIVQVKPLHSGSRMESTRSSLANDGKRYSTVSLDLADMTEAKIDIDDSSAVVIRLKKSLDNASSRLEFDEIETRTVFKN